MTRRAKIVVGVVMLSAVVLFGSAIAQATSPHTSREQRVKAGHPAPALHRQVRAEKSAKAKESRSRPTHAQVQTTTRGSKVEMEQPDAVGPEAADDDSPGANDDDQGEQADDDEAAQADDDQAEHEDAATDDQGDDSTQADVEHDNNDDSSTPSDDDSHEDDDTGDSAGDD